MVSIARVKSRIIRKELVKDMQVRSVLFKLPCLTNLAESTEMQEQLYEAKGKGASLAILPLNGREIKGSYLDLDQAITQYVKNLNCGRNPDFPGVIEIYNALPSLIETCYVVSYGHSSTSPNAEWMNHVRTVKNSGDIKIGPVLDEIMAGLSLTELKDRLAWVASGK